MIFMFSKNTKVEVDITTKKTEKEKSKGVKLINYMVLQFWKDALPVIVVWQVFFHCVGFRIIVPTGSMLPTLEINGKYIVTSYTTLFKENKGLEHGDIVVFRNRDLAKELLVKRVIGLPGDTIEIQNGILFRNGEIINEDYVRNNEHSVIMEAFVVPDGEMFVLGDNRGDSHDGRFWDAPTISLSCVKGELVLN